MESNDSETVSTQKLLPPSYDPGWNDPPKWVLSNAVSAAATATNNSSKRMLNKRVPFPLSPKTTASISLTQSVLKDVETDCHSSECEQIKFQYFKEEEQEEEEKEREEERKEERDLTRDALSDVLENLRVCMEENGRIDKLDDLQKRMDVLRKCWTDGTFKDSVKRNILDISRALREREVEKADKIHLTLLMNHSNVCSPWIPLVRHVILELKEKKKNREDE